MNCIEIQFKHFVTLQRGFDLPKSRMLGGVVPVLGSNRVIGHHSEIKVEGPGVVTGRSGTLGLVQYSERPFWPHNTTLWVKDFKGNNPKFVYYKLKTLHLERFNGGASVPTLNRNVLDTLLIRIPRRAEQVRIASILSTYDDLIENNRRRIGLLEDAARMLYREWFVHFRFPGHEHVRIADGIPEGWQRMTLGSVLNLQRGFDLPVNKRVAGGVSVYGSTGIVGNHNVAKVTFPTLTTGRSGSLGKVCLVEDPCWPLNTSLWVTEFKAASIYFSYFMLSELNLAKLSSGASVPTLDRKVAHSTSVVVPTRTLAKMFDEQMEVLFRNKKLLSQQIQKLAQARDLLLPRLMNGEIAV